MGWHWPPKTPSQSLLHDVHGAQRGEKSERESTTGQKARRRWQIPAAQKLPLSQDCNTAGARATALRGDGRGRHTSALRCAVKSA